MKNIEELMKKIQKIEEKEMQYSSEENSAE